jgi:hypothetical protein
MSKHKTDWEAERAKEDAFYLEQRRRTYVTPECCQTVQDTAAIFLQIHDNFCQGDLETPPTWHIRTASIYGRDTCSSRQATFCPFCAAPVPEIEKRVTDRKIMVVKDGGYYCATCDERCNCCLCLPAAFHWQAKGAVAIIPPSPERERDEEEE